MRRRHRVGAAVALLLWGVGACDTPGGGTVGGYAGGASRVADVGDGWPSSPADVPLATPDPGAGEDGYCDSALGCAGTGWDAGACL